MNITPPRGLDELVQLMIEREEKVKERGKKEGEVRREGYEWDAVIEVKFVFERTNGGTSTTVCVVEEEVEEVLEKMREMSGR